MRRGDLISSMDTPFVSIFSNLRKKRAAIRKTEKALYAKNGERIAKAGLKPGKPTYRYSGFMGMVMVECFTVAL